MLYWGIKIHPADRLWLVAGSPSTLVVVLESRLEIDGKEQPSFWTLGPTRNDEYSDVENFCDWVLGGYNGHLALSVKEYSQFDLKHSCWIWSVDVLMPTLIKIMRVRWLKNEDIPDHENRLFSYLGFNEFYASKHAYLQEHGRLPTLVEGRSM